MKVRLVLGAVAGTLALSGALAVPAHASEVGPLQCGKTFYDTVNNHGDIGDATFDLGICLSEPQEG